MIAYSLVTRYECGAVGVLPVPWRLRLDLAGGLLLAASSWLFGFAYLVWWPHVKLGLFSTVAARTTRTVPRTAGVGE